MEEKKYAVLIDGDNISSKYLDSILNEMTKYGIATYKRIYCDFTSQQSSKWRRLVRDSGIQAMQQFANTVGKNATDSTLIIDAMDILYTGNVDGFCIVSSDGDFTRLAIRLKESGMERVKLRDHSVRRVRYLQIWKYFMRQSRKTMKSVQRARSLQLSIML